MSSRLCAISNVTTLSTDSELIAPCQYFDLSNGSELSGERRLMLALLADAINVYQRGATSSATRARRLFIDAETWIMTNDLNSCGLSFETVCEALGIHPGALRRRIIKWKHAMLGVCSKHNAKSVRLRVMRRARHSSHRRGRPRTVPAAS